MKPRSEARSELRKRRENEALVRCGMPIHCRCNIIIEYAAATIDNSLMSSVCLPVPPRPARRPTCRIVVPIGLPASRQIAAVAHIRLCTIRAVVLSALAGAGITTAVPYALQRPLSGQRAGRHRVKSDGYSVCVVLPPPVFRQIHRRANARGWTVAHFVRVALKDAGFAIGVDELVVDRRRRGFRTPRRHYAMGGSETG